MSDLPAKSEFLIYEAENGAIKLEVRFEGETVWLSQQLMADLFQTTQQNISLHLQNIYEEGELRLSATHKEFLSVRRERIRQADAAGGEFEKAVRQLPTPPKGKTRGKK